MPTPPDEEQIQLDTEPLDDFMKRTPALIERQKAKTANLLAMSLVIGVLVSLPIHLVTLLCRPESADSITTVFEKWYALVSPCAGAAVGAYYAAQAKS